MLVAGVAVNDVVAATAEYVVDVAAVDIDVALEVVVDVVVAVTVGRCCVC